MNPENKFLEDNLVTSFSLFKKLNRGYLNKLNTYLLLGYIFFALPLLVLVSFFYFLNRDPDFLEHVHVFLVYLIFGISIFLPGMFYFVFKDDLQQKKRAVKDIFHEYTPESKDVVLNDKPFIFYARGFSEERNLGNQNLSNSLDRKFNIKSTLEEEMDRVTAFSYLPNNLTKLLTETGYPIVALGHKFLKRDIKPVQLFFCKDTVWEAIFKELAARANMIILNTLEKQGDYVQDLGDGLIQEFNLILNNELLLNKTFVLYNKFENELQPRAILQQIIHSAKWSSPFVLHNPKTQKFIPPKGSVPKEVEDLISSFRT